MMNAMEAGERIKTLDDRIEALDIAYRDLWDTFDKRLAAITIEKIKVEIERERSILADKLRAVQL